MQNMSNAFSTAKDSLKQHHQLPIEWNAVKELSENQSSSNKRQSVIREKLKLLRSQKDALDMTRNMKLQLTIGVDNTC